MSVGGGRRLVSTEENVAKLKTVQERFELNISWWSMGNPPTDTLSFATDEVSLEFVVNILVLSKI